MLKLLWRMLFPPVECWFCGCEISKGEEFERGGKIFHAVGCWRAYQEEMI